MPPPGNVRGLGRLSISAGGRSGRADVGGNHIEEGTLVRDNPGADTILSSYTEEGVQFTFALCHTMPPREECFWMVVEYYPLLRMITIGLLVLFISNLIGASVSSAI